MKANKSSPRSTSHTGGEPTRLIVSGIPLKGRTLLEQRDYMRKNLDHLRSALMCEPRGHRGMFGAVMAPRDPARGRLRHHLGRPRRQLSQHVRPRHDRDRASCASRRVCSPSPSR